MEPASIVEDTGGQGETNQYIPPKRCRGGGSYYDIQIVLPLWSAHVLMAKNDAHYFIYIYIAPWAPDKGVKAYISGYSPEDIAI